MEHATITPLENGYVRITPDEGYRLYNRSLDRYFSEAVVKQEQTSDYVAVAV